MDILSPQLDHLWILGNRDHPQGMDIAPIPQLTIGDGSDAAASPSHKASQGGGAISRRSHPNFPAQLAGLLIDSHQLGPRLHPHQSRLGPDHLVELAHIQHNAPLQRNALAVITGASPSQSQGDPPPGTNRGHPFDLIFISWTEDDIRSLVPQLPLQHRAVVKIIQRQLGHLPRIRHPFDPGQILLQIGPILSVGLRATG